MELLRERKRSSLHRGSVFVKLAKLRKINDMTLCRVPPLRTWQSAMASYQSKPLRFKADRHCLHRLVLVTSADKQKFIRLPEATEEPNLRQKHAIGIDIAALRRALAKCIQPEDTEDLK